MSKYDRNCTQCNGELEATDGTIYDTYPAAYPVKCTQCGFKQSAYLQSEASTISKSTAVKKDYLEQLEEDKQILDSLTIRSSMSNPQIDAIERAIARIDKEIKHTKQLRMF